MTLRFISVGIAAALAGAVGLVSADADACGGSFSPPPDPQDPETIEIAAQRMAFSISPSQTVLWSQIEYEGPADEFAWVLPVGPGATIELASQRWFDALEAVTGAHVAPPGICGITEYYEPDSGGGCSPGCGAKAADGGGRNGGFQTDDKSTVDVVSRGTLGPYETVTLSSKDGQAVKDWLTMNGYAIPEDVGPILDEYTAAGMDFMALKLKAESSTGQIQPVRVTSKGASPTIPFKMMKAGARASLPITVYVIGEGRYAPQSYPEATLDKASLSWDFSAEKSNYADVRSAALKASENKRGFLTTFALGGGLHETVLDHKGSPVELSANTAAGGVAATSLAELYFKLTDADSVPGGGQCEAIVGTLSSNEPAVVDSCAPGACPAGSISAASLECEGAKDLAAALLGMHVGDAWVTRLEAEIPREGLTADLTLKASAVQEPMSGWIKAQAHSNCDEGVTETASFTSPRPRPRSVAWMATAFALGAAFLRRRGKADGGRERG